MPPRIDIPLTPWAAWSGAILLRETSYTPGCILLTVYYYITLHIYELLTFLRLQLYKLIQRDTTEIKPTTSVITVLSMKDLKWFRSCIKWSKLFNSFQIQKLAQIF